MHRTPAAPTLSNLARVRVRQARANAWPFGGRMAIYSTVFLALPEELPAGFPGWRDPLPEAVTRTFTHPLFQEEVTVSTREPEWPDWNPSRADPPEYRVVAIEGDYGEYLEGRLPSFVRSRAHWCSKGLTSVELDPLIALALASEAEKLESALFAHPSLPCALDVFPNAFVTLLAEANDFALRRLAQDWARAMSDPQHTHSVSGNRLWPDWTAQDALAPLTPLARLARDGTNNQRMYLFVDA